MKTRTLALLLLALVVVGCRARLDDTRTFTLPVGEIDTFYIDAIDAPRTLRVNAQSTDGTIDVYLYLESNQEEVERMITLGKDSELVLASSGASNDVALQATIPPKETAVVMVRSASQQPAEVKLTMAD